ncbi:MAG TPA: hypothetical protein VFW04_14465 [Gemmatimonadaceae bacterium]|nr:hypothetical protein [Gemmatimonadaceae bacterium]
MERWQDRLARSLYGSVSRTRTLRGVTVDVVNTRPDIDTEHIFARLDDALGIIERHQPWYFRHLVRDFARIAVRRYPCRGAYFPDERTCLVELTFSVNPEFSTSQIASTIVHEAMHARLDRRGVAFTREIAARHERFCRRAEVELGMSVPDGEPIVERALASLAASDEDVAPVIDWNVASRRVAQADLDALNAPHWLKKTLARRAGLDPGATQD